MTSNTLARRALAVVLPALFWFAVPAMAVPAMGLDWPPPGGGTYGWPGPGEGNGSLGGLKVKPMESDPNKQGKFEEAMDLLKQGGADEQQVANTLEAGMAVGAIDVVEIDNSEAGKPALGASDPSTLGLEIDGRTAAEIAATIVHEMTHIRHMAEHVEFQGQDPASPCMHADAWAREVNTLCFLSCLTEEEQLVTCYAYRHARTQFELAVEGCLLLGGTPVHPPLVCNPPNFEPTCGCAGD